MPVRTAIGGAFFLGFVAASAQAATFTFDFEGGIPTEVTGSGGVEAVQGYAGNNGFAGLMLRNVGNAGEATNVTLSGLASHDQVTLSFGLALIDSWDGPDGPSSPDFFNLLADGVEIFEISVDHNAAEPDQIPGSATNRTYGNLGFGSWNDSGFDVNLTFAHSSSSLLLSMFADGSGWQSGPDESWGIDDLVITTSQAVAPVPLPASLPLLVGGFFALGWLGLRRRKPA